MKTNLTEIMATTLALDFKHREYTIKPAALFKHGSEFDFYMLRGRHALFLDVREFDSEDVNELILQKKILEQAGLDYKGPREDRGLDLLMVSAGVTPRTNLQFAHYLDALVHSNKVANLSTNYQSGILMCCYNAPIMERKVEEKKTRRALAQAQA